MWIILYAVGLITFLVWWLSSPFYWRKRRVPHSIPFPFLGNSLSVLTNGPLESNILNYRKFSGERYFGMHMFTRPTLVVRDPELIQRILVKDFEYFTSHGLYANQDRDPGGGNLFHIYGQQWKEMRAKLSPFFTPAKVKVMLSYADKTISKLINVIDKKTIDNKPIEMAQILMNVTTDVITQAVFGIETDTFENEDSVFSKIAKEMFKPTITLRIFVSQISPWLYDLCKFYIFGKEGTEKVVEIVRKTIDYRRKNNVRMQDFLQGMMDLVDNNNGLQSTQKYFPDNTRVPCYDVETLISQALVLYAAGVETSALTMTYFLYEIATNPEIQEKCRSEINNIEKESAGGDITIGDISKLVYLGAALQETLRLHSPVTLITRECTKNYKMPGSDLIIEKGTIIHMTPNGVQLDPKYYPEPEKFKPERFLNQEQIIGGSFFPFGLGPRTCIGMGLAYGEMKLVTAKLLQRYEFSPCSMTDGRSGTYDLLKTPINGMWLNVRPISKKNQ
ncbi:hypothetical protein O3M35_007218 [Rhynocoris fuscipes]|uniref:Cytochrome P450 n=1 Tax=Rhynocoris fuscipes TaxID=488301 RepID=A0AAW1DEA4_9HEMI